MPKVSEALRNAQVLAEFANLEADRVDYFRHNYPDFFPSKWWAYRNGEQWRMTQDLLRSRWKMHAAFPKENANFAGGGFYLTQLVLSVFNPDELVVNILMGAYTDPNLPEPLRHPRFAPIEEMRPWGHTAFQQGVLYLFAQPWRARFCLECKRRFVAAEPKNKFCRPRCSEENRLRQQREWWSRYGREWRRKRRAPKPRVRKGRKA